MVDFNRVATESISLYEQTALIRLKLYTTGETHRIFGDLYNTLAAQLTKLADDEGRLVGIETIQAQKIVDAEWGKAYTEWVDMFQMARFEAASIPFGAMALYHQRFFAGYVQSQADSAQAGGVLFLDQGPGQTGDRAFDIRRTNIVEAAARRTYSDGFILSSRVWNLDQTGLNGIRKIIRQVSANQLTMKTGLKNLEKYLGADQECPRWTKARMKLKPSQIKAGDQSGLLSGTPCGCQGVSYNALRLMRNELAIVHNMAVDEALLKSPWVEEEQISLHPLHPCCDDCDTVANGGRDGKGIYPLGTWTLPLHILCSCRKSAITLTQDEFNRRFGDFMAGESPWPKMNEYATCLGIGVQQLQAAQFEHRRKSLEIWTSRDTKAMKAALTR